MRKYNGVPVMKPARRHLRLNGKLNSRFESVIPGKRTAGRRRISFVALVFIAIAALCGCHKTEIFQTARHPVTNEYHGVKVVDDYLWLEKADDPAVKKWSEGQNAQARAFLDKLPVRSAVESR